jgi:hypothetical protein
MDAASAVQRPLCQRKSRPLQFIATRATIIKTRMRLMASRAQMGRQVSFAMRSSRRRRCGCKNFPLPETARTDQAASPFLVLKQPT